MEAPNTSLRVIDFQSSFVTLVFMKNAPVHFLPQSQKGKINSQPAHCCLSVDPQGKLLFGSHRVQHAAFSPNFSMPWQKIGSEILQQSIMGFLVNVKVNNFTGALVEPKSILSHLLLLPPASCNWSLTFLIQMFCGAHWRELFCCSDPKLINLKLHICTQYNQKVYREAFHVKFCFFMLEDVID